MPPSHRFHNAVVDQLLGEIVDSQEKLDIVVYLHSTGSDPCATVAIAADDGRVVWRLDTCSGWLPVIDSIASLCPSGRMDLLRRITELALDRLRREAGGEIHNVIVLRPARRIPPSFD